MMAPNVSESTIVFDGTTFESTADWLRSTRRSKARTPARYDAARGGEKRHSSPQYCARTPRC